MGTEIKNQDQFTLDVKYQPLLLEALQELLYKIALDQEVLKGQAMTNKRKELTTKQMDVEELQHLISTWSG